MPPIQVSMGLNNLLLSIAMWAVSLGHPAVPPRGVVRGHSAQGYPVQHGPPPQGQKDGGSMAAAFLAFECRVSWGRNFGVEL